MTENVQLPVQCSWFHALETLGTVGAHHAGGDIAEGDEGQWVPEERIEGEGLAVSSSLPRHHLVPVALHDVGHRDALERLVNLWSLLVGLQLLLTRPRKGNRLRAERARD